MNLCYHRQDGVAIDQGRDRDMPCNIAQLMMFILVSEFYLDDKICGLASGAA